MNAAHHGTMPMVRRGCSCGSCDHRRRRQDCDCGPCDRRRRPTAAVCCDTEAFEPESTEGAPHDYWCRTRAPLTEVRFQIPVSKYELSRFDDPFPEQ